MKFSTGLAAGLTLAAGTNAIQLPAWMQNLAPSSNNNRPSVPSIPSFSVPSFPGMPAFPTSRLGNSAIPSGKTLTATATSYGSFVAVNPTIPTATPSPSTPAPVTGSNSTTNGTLVSCAQDAKKNPNQSHGANSRCNWAPGFDINTDVETTWPNTGNVVKYTLTISNGTIAPQGDQKIGFLVNGQNPGPKLEANWGDTFEITVINNLQNNGTAIHWHGFQQKQTNTQDGVGGITECPLAPGDSKTYRFQATSYGTTWYHSHFSGQYGEGVLGPIVVNGPTSYNYDIDLGAVAISDYYPLTAFQEEWIASRFGPPTATNYLLNGQNAKVDGSAGTRSKWTFQAGKKHKIRFINTSTDHHFKVQLDGHSMIVVAADFVAITPYRTNELAIAIGQRYDVIVEANQAASNYWLRALMAKDCSFGLNDGTGIANGIISYSNAASGLPTSQMTTVHNNACVDEPLSALKPIVAKSVDSNGFSATTLPVGAGVVQSSNDTVFRWTIGGISQVIDWSNPTLSNAVASANTYDAAKHVVTLPNANVWTYWVLQNQFFVPHPMHLHGHDFAILGQGTGVFSGSTSNLNFKDPMRRDVVQLVAQGWTVIAFKTDNPGAWLLHCHIAWHVSGGLSLQFLERPADIPALLGPTVKGADYTKTCNNWKKYAATSIFKQTDSGLKRREIVGDVEMEMEVMEVFPERRSEEVINKAHLDKHVRRHANHWGTQAV